MSAALGIGIALVLIAAAAGKFKVGEGRGAEVLPVDIADAQADESPYPDVVSAPEVAQLLNVSKQRVHQLIHENSRFPEPYLRLGVGPIWLRSSIEAFNASWTRKPGRPRTALPLSKEKIVADVEAASGGLMGGVRRRTAGSVEHMFGREA